MSIRVSELDKEKKCYGNEANTLSSRKIKSERQTWKRRPARPFSKRTKKKKSRDDIVAETVRTHLHKVPMERTCLMLVRINSVNFISSIPVQMNKHIPYLFDIIMTSNQHWKRSLLYGGKKSKVFSSSFCFLFVYLHELKNYPRDEWKGQ